MRDVHTVAPDDEVDLRPAPQPPRLSPADRTERFRQLQDVGSGCLAMRAWPLVVLVMLAGCSAQPPDGAPPGSPDKDLHVYVSNQSFDQPTADLLVTVDGEVLFDDEADVEGQHNWMLREADVGPGRHTLDALERDTGTRAAHTFSIPDGGQRWVVVDYWNDDEGGPRFTFHVSEEQVAFA